MSSDCFKDRADAGRRLAEKLSAYVNHEDTIVLALPRGGVPVAREVATALSLPLDVFIVRKIGAPHQPEFAIGALASGGARYLNEDYVRLAGISPQTVSALIRSEELELARRERLYREGCSALDLRNRTVILVDDGLATGASMLAAIQAVRMLHPKEVIVAVPVIPVSSIALILSKADKLYFVLSPYHFRSVGEWYEVFGQTSDKEVCELLTEYRFAFRGPAKREAKRSRVFRE